MRMQGFLIILGSRITAAEDKHDVEECKRLAHLGISNFQDYLLKCDAHLSSLQQSHETDPHD